MKVKNANLEWYVLRHDFNKDEIVNYNVMTGIADEIAKRVKAKKIYNKETLKDFLERTFLHDYWCRAEHEIMVSGLHRTDVMEKIDIWRQLEMNLDQIVEYVNLKCDLKF